MGVECWKRKLRDTNTGEKNKLWLKCNLRDQCVEQTQLLFVYHGYMSRGSFKQC